MSDRESLDEKIERLEAEQEDLKDTVSKMLPSRRNVLKGMATAGGAGALGFSAGSATAANDTSVGNVGAVNSPVDVYLDEIKDHGGDVVADIDDSGPIDWQGRGFDNLGSVSTDEINNTDDILIFGSENGFIERIDPGSSTTPVQDAFDKVSGFAKGTVILLPMGIIKEDGPVQPADRTTLIGRGFQNTQINIQNTSTTGLDFANGNTHMRFADFGIRLPGPDENDTGPAIDFRSQVSSTWFERLRLQGVRGDVITATTADRPFQIKFSGLDIRDSDAGNSTALININTPGPSWEFDGPIVFAPTDSHSAADSKCLFADTVKGLSVGNVNIGGTPDRGIDLTNCRGFFVENVHYEPTTQNSVTDFPFAFREKSYGSASGLVVTGTTVDWVIASYGGGALLPRPFVINSTVNNNTVYLDNAARSSLYMGDRADVDNQATAGPPYFWCGGEMLPANPLAEGTTTVPAGGTARKSGTHSVGQKPDVRIAYTPASNPANDAAVSVRRIYDASLDAADIQFKEELGNSDLDIDYVVY